MKTLIDIQDDLSKAKGFVVAAYLACEHEISEGPHRHGICTVVNEAWQCLDVLIDEIQNMVDARGGTVSGGVSSAT